MRLQASLPYQRTDADFTNIKFVDSRRFEMDKI